MAEKQTDDSRKALEVSYHQQVEQLTSNELLDSALRYYNEGNYHAAIKIWRKAADQGNAPAQHNLGVMYDTGLGVAQDYAQAAQWFRKAADQGFAQAQYNLGIMYYNGQGVAQVYAQAAQWYRKAADQGDARAQTNLGVMYDTGLGVAQNTAIAYALFNLSAGEDSSSENLATEARRIAATAMPETQIELAQALSQEMASKGVSVAIDGYLNRHKKSRHKNTTEPVINDPFAPKRTE